MDTSYALLYTSGMPLQTFETFAATANVIPVVRRIMADHLSPVLAYRRLVAADNRTAPSFLFESVENGDKIGRFSFLGADPSLEVIAYEHEVIMRDHTLETEHRQTCDNPLQLMRELSENWEVSAPVATGELPLPNFIGGWVGFAGYDSARFTELDVLPFSDAPKDDRNLPDLHFALYRTVVIFDHVAKIVHVVHNAMQNDSVSSEEAWKIANKELDRVVSVLQEDSQNIQRLYF